MTRKQRCAYYSFPAHWHVCALISQWKLRFLLRLIQVCEGTRLVICKYPLLSSEKAVCRGRDNNAWQPQSMLTVELNANPNAAFNNPVLLPGIFCVFVSLSDEVGENKWLLAYVELIRNWRLMYHAVSCYGHRQKDGKLTSTADNAVFR